MCSSLWPRSRRRATIRACATAAVVQSPVPSTSGITPSRAQRRRVSGDTPTRSAASFTERVSATALRIVAVVRKHPGADRCAAMASSKATAEWKGSLRRCMRAPARLVGRRRRASAGLYKPCEKCCAPARASQHRLPKHQFRGGSLNYFVTGATGFIGRHLVAELLKREGTIYALVREGSRGKLDALVQRLGAEEGRIKPVTGDLSKPGLGVDSFDEKIDHLFHLAAVYDVEADEESSERANVDGTKHVIEFANAHDVGRFHHTSSIAVAGNYKGVFQEDMFDEGQKLPHHYHRTKYEAERLVREGVETKALIYRPGIVVGHSETGEMDKIDGPYYFFKLLQKLRTALPEWFPLAGPEGGQTNIVPVDFVARAMDHISHLPDGELPGDTFHLVNPEPLKVGEALNTFAKAGHAPQFAMRVDSHLTNAIPKPVRAGFKQLPPVKRIRQQA